VVPWYLPTSQRTHAADRRQREHQVRHVSNGAVALGDQGDPAQLRYSVKVSHVPVAAAAPWYLPVWHRVQCTLPTTPAFLPATQSTQAVVPTVLWLFPTGHTLQEDFPAPSSYLPFWQFLQLDCLVLRKVTEFRYRHEVFVAL